jgi:uncharacterized protein YggE
MALAPVLRARHCRPNNQKDFPMIRIFPLAALAVLLAFNPAAADDGMKRFVAVQGSGSVTATPDQAHVNTGITTKADTARQALDANNAAMARLMAALKQAGIEEKDIRTSNFNVSPWYEPYVRNRPRVIGGYQASNQVRVRVRDLAKLGGILDAVVTAGSNRVNGVQFDIAEPEALMDDARRKAVADAKRRATLYAEAAGAKLGRVVSINEQATHFPRPFMVQADSLRSAKAAEVPVSPGTQEISATVSVRFELE